MEYELDPHAPSPAPAPPIGTIIAEAVPTSEDIDSLNRMIRELQKILIICEKKLKACEKEKKKKPKKHEYRTKGWTIIKGATAFSGDPGNFFYDPPLTSAGIPGGADHPLTIDTFRRESKGYGGFVFGAGSGRKGWGWVRSQVKTPDELIINITRDRGGDVHVQPGASKSLLRDKEAEGYEVIYSPDEEQSFVLPRAELKKKKRKRKKHTRKKKKSNRKF